MIAVKFSVRGRDLAGACVAEAQSKTRDLFNKPYSDSWSGEFDQIAPKAEQRLMLVVPVSMCCWCFLLILSSAFRSGCSTRCRFLRTSWPCRWKERLLGPNSHRHQLSASRPRSGSQSRSSAWRSWTVCF